MNVVRVCVHVDVYSFACVCAGFGGEGQLGLESNASVGGGAGSMGDNLPAVDLGTERTAIAIAPGGAHTCAGQSRCRFL